MNEILDSLAAIAERNAKMSEHDYVKDGLLHCGECNTPRQCRVCMFGVDKIVFCVCKCQQEKREAEEAERKAREEAERIGRLKSQGIQDRQIHDWNFTNDDGSNPAMSDKAMRYCVKWPEMYEKNIGLLKWGTVGNGKTFFAACIANYLIEHGVPVLMTSFAKIINAMSGFTIEDKNGYINDFNRYRLLIIDDLGAERQSEFAQEIVYNVIDGRYKNGQPLIVTTNMTLDEIRNPKNITYSRIYDRILEMCVPLHFDGESRRRAAFQNKIDSAKALFGD